MTSRANPSTISRHDVRRQLFRSAMQPPSIRVQGGGTAASMAPTGGPSSAGSSTVSAVVASHQRPAASTSSSTASAAGNYRSQVNNHQHQSTSSTAAAAAAAAAATAAGAATLHVVGGGVSASFIPTKSRGRAIRSRMQPDTGPLDGFAAHLSASRNPTEATGAGPSSSRWEEPSGRLQPNGYLRKKQPTIIAEDDEIIVHAADGGYGESLETPLQMMAQLRPDLMREKEALDRLSFERIDYSQIRDGDKQNMLESIQQAIILKVQSLQHDNWMYGER